VAIYRLLQHQAFDPDDIRVMTTAYKDALRVLRLKNRDDPVTETVAQKIIEIAQTGVRDPTAVGWWLCSTGVKEPELKMQRGRVRCAWRYRSSGNSGGAHGT
jgi:hypothetical protein